ncbi:MAG: 23S rRNA (uracil(1939)-C(5))-methyltransferase RlmD [Ruminococcaceae bacterium]|nr:23S rRNA (uracil(1939)-C(5))-methyltransferase RlmD [Oscillospiraceae bacterium]
MQMLKKNEIHRLSVTEINDMGYGVGRINGMIVFTAAAVTGDVADVRLIKVNRSYAVARIEKLITPSPHRTEAACSVSGKCGGCVYMHVEYEYEKQLKRENVRKAFADHGLFPVVEEVRDDGRIHRHRNKAMYPVDGALKIGFFRAKTNDIIEQTDCLLQPAVFADIVEEVKAFCLENKISGYDRESGKGLLRHLYLRMGEATGEVLLCVVHNGRSMPCEEELCARVRRVCPALVGVMVNENGDRGSKITGERYRCLWGRPYLTDVLCGVTLKIHPNSFYQVNRGGAELLYDLAIDEVEKAKPKRVLDLFCGIGSIGLAAAKRLEGIELCGYEIVPEAVENAKENAELNGIENARFVCGDLDGEVSGLDALLKTSDLVILDPPRKGIDETLCEKLIASGIRHIVYVSCDCKTLARDCALLTQGGYTLSSVKPVNLFPRTKHCECVLTLTR